MLREFRCQASLLMRFVLNSSKLDFDVIRVDDLDRAGRVALVLPGRLVAENEVRGIGVALDDLVPEIDSQVAQSTAVGLRFAVLGVTTHPCRRALGEEQPGRQQDGYTKQSTR